MFQVNGKPFLMLAGEVHNSNSSTLTAMQPVWRIAKELGMNSILLPVSWELIEPEEGKFDFGIVDGLIREARENGLRLGFLWFGTWKNAGCGYAPAWVKTDLKRFPRAQLVKGKNKCRIEMFYGIEYTTLSVFGEETCKADARAFAQLCKHIKTIDKQEHTVIYIQVENEAGLLGAAREYSDIADERFAGEVPADFTAAMRAHSATMREDIRKSVKNGKENGSWAEVYGDDAEEIFYTYHVAKYIDSVAAAGKAEYEIPMAVNVWLDQGGGPGAYPTGGPINKMLELWKICAPHIDLLTPDIYVQNFLEVCDQYTRLGDPLMIPETATHGYAGSRLVYVIGHYHALGFSPFGFEELGEVAFSAGGALLGMDETDPLLGIPQNVAEYRWYNETLASMMPMLTDAYGTGKLQAVISERPDENIMNFGVYRIGVNFESRFVSRRDGICLGLQITQDTFYFVINACALNVASNDETWPHVDYLDVEEGHFEEGKWVCDRRLNGDETGLMAFSKPTLLRVRLYSYR